MTTEVNPFNRWAKTTAGLGQLFPIRSEKVIRDALPSRLIPAEFSGHAFPMTYLDSAASTQQSGIAREAIAGMPYANMHSSNYNAARAMTHAYQRAREVVLDFVGADPATHQVVFLGNGATAACNRVARNLFCNPSDNPRKTVLFSQMEHHANILPWRRYAERTIGLPVGNKPGDPPLNVLLSWNRNQYADVRLIAITLASNVTGIVNDIARIADVAHQIGAEVLVDAAQGLVHHWGINMQNMGIDYLVASGHKAYVRRAPGILVMPRRSSPKEADDMGGGIVRFVRMDGHELAQDHEEAGTPNPLGAIGLAANLKSLKEIGMQNVWTHEKELTQKLIAGFSGFSAITVYGDTDMKRTPRTGVVSFNIQDLYHAVVSKALSDYFNIATRNGCFCAQPYVASLLGTSPQEQAAFEAATRRDDFSQTPGMVRASLGMYTSEEDIDRLLSAVGWLVENKRRIQQEYFVNSNGEALRHDGWEAINPKEFSPI